MGADGLGGCYLSENVDDESMRIRKLEKELSIYKEMLTNIIDNIQADFDLYRVGKQMQDELEKRLKEIN